MEELLELRTLLIDGNISDALLLVEEIESLGKQQKQELRNRLGILIGYLLKWDYQPELRSKSWKATIWENESRL